MNKDRKLSNILNLLQGKPTLSIDKVRSSIKKLSQIPTAEKLRSQPEAEEIYVDLLKYLNNGSLRSAEPVVKKNREKSWKVNSWVRKGIVDVGFRLGEVSVASGNNETLQFSDKHTLPTLPLNDAAERNIRIVPGGSSIRIGSYIGKSVIMMPPSYVNIGAYVGDRTMIDSLAVVGSCAQVGKNVHIAAGAKVGGVLEPANARPCIVEDDVRMLADSGIYEGVMLKKGAVLAPNVILTSGIEVWERKSNGDYIQLKNSKENPISIPERALVVPRTRNPIRKDGSLDPFAKQIALIAAYYPKGGNPELALNEALRS